MSAPPELIHVVRQWIYKADNDLLTAEHILTLRENCPFEAVCFHAQQCAEKYLKALLVSRSINFPKTHDFRILIRLVPADIKLVLDQERLFSLNRYVIDSRYPGDYEAFAREEAEQAVEIARKVKAEIQPKLPAKAFTNT